MSEKPKQQRVPAEVWASARETNRKVYEHFLKNSITAKIAESLPKKYGPKPDWATSWTDEEYQSACQWWVDFFGGDEGWKKLIEGEVIIKAPGDTIRYE